MINLSISNEINSVLIVDAFMWCTEQFS